MSPGHEGPASVETKSVGISGASSPPARYEDRIGDNHHHIICRRCGKTVDVDCAVGETPCLAAADSGFRIDEAEVIFWGTCPECLAETRRLGD